MRCKHLVNRLLFICLIGTLFSAQAAADDVDEPTMDEIKAAVTYDACKDKGLLKYPSDHFSAVGAMPKNRTHRETVHFNLRQAWAALASGEILIDVDSCRHAEDVVYNSQGLPTVEKLDELQTTAGKGDADSQLRLGTFYLKERNCGEALKWVQKAAEQTSVNAEEKLGISNCLATNAVEKSRQDNRDQVNRVACDKLITTLRGAAEQGSVDAEFRIGDMYYMDNNTCVSQDYLVAEKWIRIAAQKGSEAAQERLAQMYFKGEGVPHDEVEGKKWQEMANKTREGIENARIETRNRANLSTLFALALAIITFVGGMNALQSNELSKWKKMLLTPIVHIVGIALVLNSINTYFWFLFSNSTTPNVLTYMNLAFRFMAGIGFGLDALAIWYLTYLFKWRRGKARAPTSSGTKG